MDKHEKAIETLRLKGHRLTPQRLIVLSIISGASSGGHMGVDEVFQAAKKAYPYMDIATVYRTLHLFKDLGVVPEVAIGDRLPFDLPDPAGHHHHTVGVPCNASLTPSTAPPPPPHPPSWWPAQGRRPALRPRRAGRRQQPRRGRSRCFAKRRRD